MVWQFDSPTVWYSDTFAQYWEKNETWIDLHCTFFKWLVHFPHVREDYKEFRNLQHVYKIVGLHSVGENVLWITCMYHKVSFAGKVNDSEQFMSDWNIYSYTCLRSKDWGLLHDQWPLLNICNVHNLWQILELFILNDHL